MEDRYLFKAKRIDNGEWVQGTLLHKSSSFSIECDEYYIFDGIETSSNDDLYLVEPTTICQCTGRENEWEHDVFQYDDERYEIQFCEDSLTWEAVSVFSSESIGLGEFSPSEYVRLGNSIDNPELLEVGE